MFGIESFNQEILDECNKDTTVEQNVQAVLDGDLNAFIKAYDNHLSAKPKF